MWWLQTTVNISLTVLWVRNSDQHSWLTSDSVPQGLALKMLGGAAIIWRCDWRQRACFQGSSDLWLVSWWRSSAGECSSSPWTFLVCPPLMAAGFPLSAESQRPMRNFSVLYNLVSWVTHCHICQNLPVRQSSPNFRWKDRAQNMNTWMETGYPGQAARIWICILEQF